VVLTQITQEMLPGVVGVLIAPVERLVVVGVGAQVVNTAAGGEEVAQECMGHILPLTEAAAFMGQAEAAAAVGPATLRELTEVLQEVLPKVILRVVEECLVILEQMEAQTLQRNKVMEETEVEEEMLFGLVPEARAAVAAFQEAGLAEAVLAPRLLEPVVMGHVGK